MASRCSTAVVLSTRESIRFTFLKAISKEFDIAPQRSAVAQMEVLEEFLVQQYQDGKTVLVMVDEAQLLRLERWVVSVSCSTTRPTPKNFARWSSPASSELRDRMMTRRYKAFRSRIVGTGGPGALHSRGN